MVFAESKRWACFLPSSARSGFPAVRTQRREKRVQREAIVEKQLPPRDRP